MPYGPDLGLSAVRKRVGGANGLSTIFHDKEGMVLGELHEGLHVGGLAVEVNGYDSLGFGANRGAHLVQIQ